MVTSFGPPDHLYLELSDRCNLRCRHCYLAAGPTGGRHLEPATARKAIQGFADLGGRAVTLSGGEPLLSTQWPTLVEHARSLGLDCTVMTNGVLLDHQTLEQLAGLGASIALSVESMRRQEHEAIRGERSFRHVTSTLERLVTTGMAARTTICCTPTRATVRGLASTINHLTTCGFSSFYLSLLEDRGRQQEHRVALQMDNDDKLSLLTQLVLLLTSPCQRSIHPGHLVHFLSRLLGWSDDPQEPIEATIRVDTGGQVFLSAYTKHAVFRLGDLHHQGLADCWRSPTTHRLITAAQARAAGLEDCADCTYWYWCRGGSPVRAYAEHGTFFRADDLCAAKLQLLPRWFAAQSPPISQSTPCGGQLFSISTTVNEPSTNETNLTEHLDKYML